MSAAPPGAPGARWWEGRTLYQVYVRSWKDSNGDGVGDLRGVIQGLDYLQWLGVDGIWLSPTMPSPNDDWGYDVADYTGVDPELGTMADLDQLVAEAGRRDIAVLLDLVPNHTSAAHPWFVEARSGRDAPRRDWYVWADPAPGGGPPTNWLDGTGASAWTLDEGSGQYYLHNFLPTQPDLNWWNPEVHAAFESILRFWFDRGIAGFRIDVAHALYKDADLRDDPPSPVTPEARFGQLPAYSKNRPEVHEVYRAWRKLAEQYDPSRLLLGETWVLPADRLAAFYGDDDELQLALNLAFIFSPLHAAELRRVVADTLEALPPEACPLWTVSNHDVSRFPTRAAGDDPAAVRAMLVVIATLPGALLLYYGDELGLGDVVIDPSEQRDAMSWGVEGDRFNRDRARTPMPWDESAHAGFTSPSARPWLPVGDRAGQSVAAQRDDPGSVLTLTRELLRLRRAYFSGVPDYADLGGGPDQWVYRCGPLAVAANLSPAPAEVEVPAGRVLLSTDPTPPPAEAGGGSRVPLGPWQALVLLAGTPDTQLDRQEAARGKDR